VSLCVGRIPIHNTVYSNITNSFGTNDVFYSDYFIKVNAVPNDFQTKYYESRRVQRGEIMYGTFGGFTRWAIVFLIIFVLFFLIVPGAGY
jgi:hypothetical protein